MACSSCAKKAGLKNNRVAAKYQSLKNKKLRFKNLKPNSNSNKQNEDKNSQQ